MSDQTLKRPISPKKAYGAIRALLKDKEDTSQVFRIVEALTGSSFAHPYKRFRRSGVGARVLLEEADLLDVLKDKERLEKCPPESLGAAYLAFVYGEGLTAEGLVEASDAGRNRERNPDAERFVNRIRDMHDLWHVTTGYGRDGLGELSLLSFSTAQLWNPGIALIILIGMIKSKTETPHLPALRVVVEGYLNGKSALWLPKQDWEHLLDMPLEEVRRMLYVKAPKVYMRAKPAAEAVERAFQAARDENAAAA